MKSKIKSGIKIYLFTIIFIFAVCFGYSLYLSKNGSNMHLIAKLVIGGSSFFILGLAYGNAVHKKGLLVGLATSIIHLLLIKMILFLATGSFDFNILLFASYALLGGIGGLLGGNFKKLF